MPTLPINWLNILRRRGGFSPIDLPNKLIWYDSEDITEVSGKASELIEKFYGVNKTIQTTDSKRPTIVSNDLNGRNGLLFDGVTQRMLSTDAIAQAQPFTLYLVANHVTAVNNVALTGGVTSILALPLTTLTVLRLFAGSLGPTVSNKIGIPIAIAMELSGATSDIRLNELDSSDGSAGANAIGGNIVIGAQVDSDASCANVKMYEYVLYSGVHDAATKNKMWQYFQNKYENAFGRPELMPNKFDGIMDNGVIYSEETGYNVYSSFAEYSFNTSDTVIYVKANPTLNDEIHVFEDGVYTQSVTFASWDYEAITLSAGSKKVTLVNDWNTEPVATISGCFITDLKLFNYSKVTGNVTNKIAIIGDSIAVGGVSTTPVTDGFIRLFTIEDLVPVAHDAWAYGELADFAANSTLISNHVVYLSTLFSNVTGRKILVTQPGINDYMLSSLPAATYKTYYENLLDAIHAADADIEIYCLSLIYREPENVDIVAYRTALSEVCTARAWATYINGLPICTYPGDYTDTVHPNTAGHKKIKDALDAVIFP